jgi:hypothetical protein
VLRVLHLPTTVGGNPQGLSRHLKEIGIRSESWALSQNYLGYPADKVIYDKQDSIIVRELKKVWALHYFFSEYDIIHYNFGSTLYTPITFYSPGGAIIKTFFRIFYSSYMNVMQLLELNVLRWRKVPIFVHYQGDDARQGDYCLEHFEITAATQVGEEYYNAATDQHKRAQINRLAKYCKKIYALNPDLMHVLPPHAEFLPYSHISLSEWCPNYTQLKERPLKIGHAPSHRKVKGTELLLGALNQLETEGYQFELVLVEGLSNVEAKQCYEDIDVLVDQLFVGWYGGLAVEVMALGKPVLVYIRETDLNFIPNQMRKDMPFINVTPDTLEEGLRSVLEMPRIELYQLAKRSRAYVEKWHDPIVIAMQVKADYEEGLRRREKLYIR